MPPDSGMAFVVIQHLPPDRQSMVAEIISKHTRMPVQQVRDGMPVEVNHVYVIRPGHTLTIKNGRLHLGSEVDRPRHGRPVDDFLKSLAEEQREKAICIIMSGMGSNGAAGAQGIKAVGGICIAQDPETAAFPSMPRQLIEAGYADYVLRLSDMPDALIGYIRHPYTSEHLDASELARGEQHHLREILAILRTRIRQDFSGYKKPTVLRRIQRRMGLNRLTDLGEYARFLRQSAVEIAALGDDLLIHVTGFFRDAEAWEALRTHVIVPLVAARESGESVRCWVAACSSGEEAYSLAILLVEEMERVNKSLDIKVFATDTAERTLLNARNGVYPGGIEADISPGRLNQFFTREDAVYRIRQDLREKVVFAPQNVLQDPPFSRLDIATCRNLLIYLEPDLQNRVVQLLHFGVREGGAVFLGSSETVPADEGLFEVIDKKARIFRRVGPTRNGTVDFPKPRAGLSAATQFERGAAKPSLAQSTTRALLDRHVPAAVTIDRDFRIHYFLGNTNPYLNNPTGEPTRDLLLLANETVRGSVRTATHKAIAEHTTITVQGGFIETLEGRKRVLVTVSPLDTTGKSEYFVVSFDQRVEPEEQFTVTDVRDEETQAEIQRIRDELQTTIEELQTSNEEHKASAEEILSMNEELQSTNEELETGKEEMQSLNEELTTVNAQLQSKIEEYQSISNDLGTLLSSIDIAVIFLDTKFRIRRFTPAAKNLFELIAADIGRPLGDLARKFADPNLLSDAQTVLNNLIPVQEEISSESGRYYIRRILPYRTEDNRIEGVVITFIDSTDLQIAEQALRQSEENLAAELNIMTRLHDITNRLLGVDDFSLAMNEILKTAIDLSDADFGDVQLAAKGSSTLTTVAQQGIDPNVLQRSIKACEGLDTPSQRASREGQSVYIEDVKQHRVFACVQKAGEIAGYNALHCLPLKTRNGETLGALSLYFRKAHRLSDRDLRGADLFAMQAADLIERINSEQRLVTLLRSEQSSHQLLTDASRMKDEFLATLSHELRTPLSTILLWGKTLRDTELSPAQIQAGLSSIVRSAESQARLIEDLMDTSRIISGKLRLEIGEIDLGNVIDQAAQAIEPTAKLKGIRVDKKIDPAIGIVRADRDRLQQVLWNILTNAVKFTPGGGVIQVRAERAGKDAKIVISDSGDGIERNFLPHVFDRFTQRDASLTRKAGGLGLGLSISKDLVEMHGGTIRAESDGPNKGASFTITLPLPVVGDTRPSKAEPHEIQSALKGKVILLVEDNASAREITTLILEQAGARVIAVDSASPAMDVYVKSRPSILVSDISLPDIDGYTLMENIRTLEAAKNGDRIPAIALTAHARREDEQRAINVGYDRHLPKPIDAHRLINVIVEMLG
jgi:two-component system CheB/CheR fusion protein